MKKIIYVSRITRQINGANLKNGLPTLMPPKLRIMQLNRSLAISNTMGRYREHQ